MGLRINRLAVIVVVHTALASLPLPHPKLSAIKGKKVRGRKNRTDIDPAVSMLLGRTRTLRYCISATKGSGVIAGCIGSAYNNDDSAAPDSYVTSLAENEDGSELTTELPTPSGSQNEGYLKRTFLWHRLKRTFLWHRKRVPATGFAPALFEPARGRSGNRFPKTGASTNFRHAGMGDPLGI